MPAVTAPATAPRLTLTPTSSAAAPPVNASSAVPCTANAMPRATISGASTPATSPSSAAASSALCTKPWPSSSPVPVKVKRRSITSPPRGGSDHVRRVGADDDEPSAHPQHVDVGAVERRERGRGHHLVGGADAEAAVHEVEHAVDERQHRVDLVRDEHDGRVGRASPPVDEVRDDLLVGEVEREQRLVAQQHRRVADQRLRHPQPLLLAAGQPPDRARWRSAPRRPTPARPAPVRGAPRPAAQPDAEAVAVEAEPDEVAGAQRQVLREGLLLRHVADGPAAARGGCPPTSTSPACSGCSPRSTRSSVVLPDPLGPSTARNSPGATSRSSPSHSVRSPKRSAAPRSEHRVPCARGSPRRSWCIQRRGQRVDLARSSR